MKLTPSTKLITSLLLATFVLMSAGTLFGYAWCVGDDGHVEVSYVPGDGCCDGELSRSATQTHNRPGFSQASDDGCGLCLDFSTQQSDAVFLKRLKRSLTPSADALSPKSFFPGITQSLKLTVSCLAAQSPPRIAQAILAHRTVVLLN